jgi:hypothetical protein
MAQVQWTRQAVYVQPNTGARSRNHCCYWKAVSITYWSVCACCACACMWTPGRVGVCIRIRVFSLANPAHNAYAPYCDVICGTSIFTVFFRHYLTNDAIFEKKKKKVTEWKIRVSIFTTTFIYTFSILRIIYRDIVKNVQTSLCIVSIIFVGF